MPAGKTAKNNVTKKAATKIPLHDERNWFVHNRFGMFIHRGLYAINAWHEQERAGLLVDAVEGSAG